MNKQRTEHPSTGRLSRSLRRVALVSSLLTPIGCSQEVDTAPTVAKVSESLNASLPGKGSGLLWRSSSDLSVWDMASSTDYRPFWLGNADSGWQPIGTGDFTGDGAGDVLWRHAGSQLLTIWQLTDTRIASVTPATANAPNLAPPFVGDLDGDGISDLVWKSQTSVSLPTPPWSLTIFITTTWLMNPGSTTPRSVTTTSSQGDIVQGLGNFDGDSLRRADILYRAPNGTVNIQLSGGGRVSPGAPGNDWQVAGIGDFNADGTSDILWYNVNSGQVSTWVMRNGAIEWSFVPGTVPPSTGWRIQGVGDVDHDGISDIIWRTGTSVSIWTMAGPGTVREFGQSLFADTSFAFAGVLDIGPPITPGALKLAGLKVEQGKTVAHVTFSQDGQRRHDQVEVWETVGRLSTFRGRVGFWQTTQSNVMEVAIDTSIFEAKDRACFVLRNWEQGRVSASSKTLCLKGLAPPVAALDWTMPDRYGFDWNADGAVDVTPSPGALSALRNNWWSVTLDACGSNDATAGGAITTYSWSIGTPGGPPAPVVDSTSCSRTISLSQGTYIVGLGVTTQDHRSTWITKEVKVKNYLIVSMGESYASGEGNPLRNAEWVWENGHPHVETPAFWGTDEDWSCHRSANAGAARAALALERSDPKSSVIYLSTACSGSEVTHLIESSYPGIIEGITVHPPQIKQVKDTLCPNCSQPEIDAVIVSTGGNDIGFADIIAACVLGSPFTPFDLCSEDTELHAEIGGKINQLVGVEIVPNSNPFTSEGTYDRLADTVAGHLNYKGFYLTEYPDPTRNNNGDVCDEIILEGAIPGDGEIGHDDLVWASSFVVGNLNVAGNYAIGQHDISDRWRTVPGISAGFSHSGYCANPHMIVHYGESMDNQGDKFGSMHPNAAGHVVYAEQIIKALARDGIGTTAALDFIPREWTVLP